jgi:elongin-A
LAGIKSERDSHKSKVVDARTLPRLPRDRSMRADPRGKTAALATRSRGPSSTLAFTTGSKTKINTGRGVIVRARREALEMTAARNSVLSTPTQFLSARASQVRTAPKGLVEDYQRAEAPRILAPRRKSGAEHRHSCNGSTTEERERRLKAFTTPSASSTKHNSEDICTLEYSTSPSPEPQDKCIKQEHRRTANPSAKQVVKTALFPPTGPQRSPQPSSSKATVRTIREDPMTRPRDAPSKTRNVSPTDNLRIPKTPPRVAKPSAPSPDPKMSRPVMKRKAEVDIFNRKTSNAAQRRRVV